jgi:hypothetical protein
MKFTHSIAAIVGAALVTLSAFAQDNHQAHHPAGASPTAAETPGRRPPRAWMRN